MHDEAGNRTNKKTYIYVQGSPPEGGPLGGGGSDSIIVDEGDFIGYWALQQNVFYVRDASGKEIAVYSGGAIDQWNVYGLDNVGKISSNHKRYFYLKDHLGSIRAVLDTTNTVISAQDYDAWGCTMENRTYQPENSKYKFTSKERDKESSLDGNGYDYFGARYYDSRVGRWNQVEPLLSKNPDLSPYTYSNNNPAIFIDPRGLNWYFYLEGSSKPIIVRKPGDDQYYLQHNEGNWVVEASGDYEMLNGLTFYEASSDVTLKFYFERNSKYHSEDINTGFETNEARKLLKGAVTQPYWALGLHFAYESRDRGLFDYKKELEESMLYLFNGYVYNQQEAGNIIWGMTLRYFDGSLLSGLLGANMFTFMKKLYHGEWPEFDESNEQTAIMRGYIYFNNHPFIKNPNKNE